MSNIPVQNGQLPLGFCPSDYQSLLNAFSAQQFVSIAGVSTAFVASASPPADHTVAWLQLDSSGRPVRVYYFAQGAWLSLHPDNPGMTKLWPQALPEVPDAVTLGLKTYDGGDGTATPSVLSGPMWQLAKTALDGTGTQLFVASMPLGVGTLPSTTVVAAQGNGGEERHQLLINEIPFHSHFENIAINRAVANGGSTDTSGAGGFVGPIGLGGTELQSKGTGGNPANSNQDDPHNNMPPWNGTYFLQRTKRLYYLVNA